MNLFIYGSCVSRDIFNLEESREFNLSTYFARSSMAALCSEAYKNDKVLENISSDFRRRMVANDFSKGLLNAEASIKEADIILIDLIDERFDVLALETGELITHSNELVESGLLKELERSSFRSIPQGTPERRGLWLEGMRCFIALLRQLNKLDKLVVNRVFWASRFEFDSATKFPVAQASIEKANAELAWMYDILSTEVKTSQFLTFAPEFLSADEKHRWGASPFHYCEGYYKEALAQLLDEKRRSHPEEYQVCKGPLVTSGLVLSATAYGSGAEVFATSALEKDGLVLEGGDFAFYLLVEGVGREVRWYGRSRSAKFFAPAESGSLEVLVFYRDEAGNKLVVKCQVKNLLEQGF
ncbi:MULTISPECIES: DUF6270 domain-containing protein [Pseudomonas]|uniref:Membrane protein n=1 Tax=Pseudomonas monteilii TaxID=76759 RepID=A0AAE6RAB6_9PSED|nr:MULTISPECIES: DUF6270 domain-containing protein [Pseudomonas]QHB26731.1 membrane protein [Pseudomonas monteilii]SNT23672.1 hypothetical protein SAMN05660216_03196 [Pseudomonas sp. LAMO17WK12:I8]SNY27627.1 hypothetical protein SAMN05660893_03036 [Pseudomonas sp. LAMO17WK12:I12]SNY28037.1 hypothetical protein SAMN05660344_03122 [Pseudomonas sp. LAMO17WK12:I11]SNY28489.1 hypothetical protein SAMN05660700_03197 [Pseudomonas sp. LAMO17WK12:I7]